MLLEALRWVRAHIAGYGGDPDSVIAVGQSAGVPSVALLMETLIPTLGTSFSDNVRSLDVLCGWNADDARGRLGSR